MADLYAGLELPKKRVAAAEARDTSAEKKKTKVHKKLLHETDAAQEQQQRKQPRSDAPLDTAATVAKLQGYMVVDKKFARASVLFGQLLDEKMTLETKSVFLDALKAVLDTKGADWSGKPELQALVQHVVDKKELLTEPRETELLADWTLLSITSAQLCTDDTYQFARAVKHVQSRLEGIRSPAAEGEDTDAKTQAHSSSTAQQLHFLMPLLRIIFSKHSTPWAKTVVETVLGLTTRRRLWFDEDDRVEVDSWTAAIQGRRAKTGVTTTSRSDARRNIIVLQDADEASNASKTSAASTVTVGRSNHPLFNIQR